MKCQNNIIFTSSSAKLCFLFREHILTAQRFLSDKIPIIAKEKYMNIVREAPCPSSSLSCDVWAILSGAAAAGPALRCYRGISSSVTSSQNYC